MLGKVWSAATLGIDAVRIVIEVDVFTGLPKCTIVGLPDASVREAYSRVRSALYNCGFRFPPSHIVVSLSPADVKKEGSAFDLPIAIGILQAAEVLRAEHIAGRVFVGELALDGMLSPVRGTLSVSADLAGDTTVRELIVPEANAGEAAAVQSVRVVGAPNLPQLVAHLIGRTVIPPPTTTMVVNEVADAPHFAAVPGQAPANAPLPVPAAGG